MENENRFPCEAIELAHANVEKGGRPFGAVVVKADSYVRNTSRTVLMVPASFTR